MLCHRRCAAVLLSLLSVLPFAAVAGEPSPLRLKKGERIIFLGDSITQAGAGHARGYVSLIKKELAEKHADLGIEVIGAGISGNKVPDLQRRLESDVLKKKPTVVVIYIGINDVWHGERDPARGTSKEKYEEGLKDIVGRNKKGGARVLLCTPSVIGEKKAGANSLDAKLDEYAALSRKVAKEMKVPLCDLRKHFVEHLEKHNPKDLERGILTSDRVHLNDAGNRLVADAILKCLGADGLK
jgi:lysophospholipase L1-like esterase